jgi:hypothetical protein
MIEHPNVPNRPYLDIYIPDNEDTLASITNILTESEALWDNFVLDKLQDLGKYRMAIVPYQNLWALAKLADQYVSNESSPRDVFERMEKHLWETIDLENCTIDLNLAERFIHYFCSECCETWHEYKQETKKEKTVVWIFTISVDSKEPQKYGFQPYIKTKYKKLPFELKSIVKALCDSLDEREVYEEARARNLRDEKDNAWEVNDLRSIRKKFNGVRKTLLKDLELTENAGSQQESASSLLHDYLADILIQQRPNHTKECIKKFVYQVRKRPRDTRGEILATPNPCYSKSIKICLGGMLCTKQSFRILLVSTASSSVLEMLPRFSSGTSRFIGGFLSTSIVGSTKVDRHQEFYKSLLPQARAQVSLPKWWKSYFEDGEEHDLAYVKGKSAKPLLANHTRVANARSLSQWVQKTGKGSASVLTRQQAISAYFDNDLAILFAGYIGKSPED